MQSCQTIYLLVSLSASIIRKIKTNIIQLTTKFVFIEMKLHWARPIFKHFLFYVFCHEIGVHFVYIVPIRSSALRPRQENKFVRVDICFICAERYFRQKLFYQRFSLDGMARKILWTVRMENLRTKRTHTNIASRIRSFSRLIHMNCAYSPNPIGGICMGRKSVKKLGQKIREASICMKYDWNLDKIAAEVLA